LIIHASSTKSIPCLGLSTCPPAVRSDFTSCPQAWNWPAYRMNMR
jgi:hypothetical protein